MINQLVTKNADVTTNALIVTLSRQEVVDFSINLFSIETVVSAWSFSQTSFNLWAYVNVFSFGAWRGTLALIVICVLCLISTQCNLADAVWCMFLMMVQRGTVEEHKALSHYLAYTSVGLFGLMTYTYYSALITSLMTANTRRPSIQSIDDIIDQGLSTFVHRGAAMETLLKTSDEDSPLGRLLKHMESQAEGYDLPYDNVGRDLKPREIMFGEELLLKKIDGLETMKFPSMPSSQLAIAWQKDSEFKAVFDFQIMKLKESGIDTKLKEKWLVVNNADKGTIQGTHPIGFQNVLFSSHSVF